MTLWKVRGYKMNQADRDKILMDLHAGQAVNAAVLREVKEDLKLHMKRTHQNEIAIEYVRRHVNFVQGALGLVSLIAIIAGVLYKTGLVN